MNRLLTITLAALFLLKHCALVQDDENEQTIVDEASATGSHDTLVAAFKPCWPC